MELILYLLSPQPEVLSDTLPPHDCHVYKCPFCLSHGHGVVRPLLYGLSTVPPGFREEMVLETVQEKDVDDFSSTALACKTQ